METLIKYNNVFITIFKTTESELNENFEAKAVDNWDSITHLSLVTALEDEFDIMIDTEDLLALRSYEIGKQILAKYDVIV
jgi:acyl carrier protein